MKPARNISPEEALSRLQDLCSTHEKCSGDAHEKLRQWNISQPDGEKIIEKLKKDKFIDDHRFTEFFVRDKQKINKWGKEKIRYALKNKGLSQEIINEALAALPTENFETSIRELLSKKSAELGKYKSHEKKNRLIRFAIQRGFEYDLIFRIIDDYINE
jgi:regulatory protein